MCSNIFEEMKLCYMGQICLKQTNLLCEKERKKDILTSFKWPKWPIWPIRPNKREQQINKSK